MPGIFISYRRETAGGYARTLADRFSEHFGEDRVFMDTKDIDLGDDFVQAIDQAIAECDALVVLIDRDWLKGADNRRRRRLDNPRDFVRLEIEAALKREVRLYPVLAPHASMPNAEELPAALSALANRNALELSETRFEDDVRHLIKALAKHVTPLPKAARGTKSSEAPVFGLRASAAPRQPVYHVSLAGTPQLRHWKPDPEEAARRKAAYQAEEKRKQRARETEPPFYMLATWWSSLVLNFVGCIGAVVLAELLARWLARLFNIQLQAVPSFVLLLLLASIPWAIAYSIVETVFYYDDPERGRKTFLTRGMFGGWTLWLSDLETGTGLVAAFPLSSILGWLMARSISQASLQLLIFDHAGIIIGTFAVATVIPAGWYALVALEEA